MNVIEICEQLKKLACQPLAKDTFQTADMLLNDLVRDNEEIEAEERANGIVREKIPQIRNWFITLCAVEVKPGLDKESLQLIISQDVEVIQKEVTVKGGLPHFKHWHK